MNTSDNLAERCVSYLRQGPPSHMTNYVPESMLEIIIAHGAKSLPLDPELREMGGFVLRDAYDLMQGQQDEAIRAYMQRGADLVKEVLER